jgi:hypothetical protein
MRIRALTGVFGKLSSLASGKAPVEVSLMNACPLASASPHFLFKGLSLSILGCRMTAFFDVQFATIGAHGTRVVIFNLWENDDGLLELDFESDPRDIQIRGGSKDDDQEKAKQFPNSSVYLTYMHSLRVSWYRFREFTFRFLLDGLSSS